MATPPVRTELADTYPEPDNATFRTGIGKLWDYVTGLLGSTGDAEEARAALGVGLSPCVRGLRGSVNATTPLTKFDLSADMVVLRDTDGATVTRYNTGTLTCDIGASGIAASSWVHIYHVWDGSSLALHPSTVDPSSFAAADLPGSNTHWCYATTIRWNASSNIAPAFVVGRSVKYDAANGLNRALTSGMATTMTTVSCASYIPPISRIGSFNFFLSLVHNNSTSFELAIRATGASHAGQIVTRATSTSGAQAVAVNWADFAVSSSQQLDYALNTSPATSGGVFIEVLGYVVPNGDS